MNMQYAIAGGELYVLEVNPRASRTMPYVSKATGVSFAWLAAQVMAGKSLDELGTATEPKTPRYYVKAPVFPFNRFPAEDTVLGPEMKSTGEVMGSSRRLRRGLREGAPRGGRRSRSAAPRFSPSTWTTKSRS
jgi:carbamoyl-phosphate synthase large subunit